MAESPSRIWFVFVIAVIVLFFATLAELFLIKEVLKKNVVNNTQSTFYFLKARIVAYLETIRLLPQVPEYLQDLTWLTDELESQPSLVGVLVMEKGRILLNTFAEDRLPLAANLLRRCREGLTKGKVFYFCGEFVSVPHRKLFLLVGYDLSLEKQAYKEAVILTVLIFLAGGVILGLAFYYFERLTKRQKELERRLSASERLAALGKLAAMVAHEIRNPLNSVLMGLQYMSEIGEFSPEIMETIKLEAKKMTELSGELLSFSKGFAIQPEPVFLRELLEELECRLLPKAEAQRISFRVKKDQDVVVRLDKRWVLRALENIVRNAFEALGQGGRVEVLTEVTPQSVCFIVRDNGPGLPFADEKHLFEPFFTTKESGFGLGLYIVREVLEAHGGTVKVESAPGKGTLFKLIFPR